MSIKLLPASLNPGQPSQAAEASSRVSADVSKDVSTSLVPRNQRAITTQLGPAGLDPAGDTFAWSSSRSSSSSRSASRGEAPFIDATPVEDSSSPDVDDATSDETTGETGGSSWEYVSGWAWSSLAAGTAIAQYLLCAASGASWSGRLVNVYA